MGLEMDQGKVSQRVRTRRVACSLQGCVHHVCNCRAAPTTSAKVNLCKQRIASKTKEIIPEVFCMLFEPSVPASGQAPVRVVWRFHPGDETIDRTLSVLLLWHTEWNKEKCSSAHWAAPKSLNFRQQQVDNFQSSPRRVQTDFSILGIQSCQDAAVAPEVLPYTHSMLQKVRIKYLLPTKHPLCENRVQESCWQAGWRSCQGWLLIQLLQGLHAWEGACMSSFSASCRANNQFWYADRTH